jgi:hypothetical protein
MSKIKRETSINLVKLQNKVPVNENLVKRVSSNNSGKITNSGKPREFGRDITNIINDKQTSSNNGSNSNINKKFNETKHVIAICLKLGIYEEVQS